ncbi:uncharacterized protein LOC130055022 [Ostrea edulis]|uniref:uncharacterized protein LOC130055022 n=1 Tax=Ostrea edulis TaxID=37623 RepID=UPI0024AF33E1|nr:uncharacterized protein LOC130055022 [Ostrea edulis]
MRLSVGLITRPHKKKLITETLNKSIRSRGVSTAIEHTPKDDFIAKRDESMMSTSQSRKEVRGQRDMLASPKNIIRLGSWNVITMYSTGKTAQVIAEMKRYHLNIIGISECRWTDSGKIRTQTGETILYSGRKDNHHNNGVAIAISKEKAKTLYEWAPINDRIITARFWSKYIKKYIKTTLIQVYAPTNDAEEESKDNFYEQLQGVIDNTPRHDIIMITGDINAKVGNKQEGEDGIVGEYGLHSERNDNGERFALFCALNNLAVSSTMFKHKDIHKQTWTSPNGQHKNQIDHVAVNGRFKRSVLDVRAHRGADVGSDHNLVITKVMLKLHKIGKKPTSSTRFETCKLKVPEVRQQFEIELRNRVNALSEDNTIGPNPNDIEESWNNIKTAYNDTAMNVLGYRKRKNQEWISQGSWKKVEERRVLKGKVESVRSERLRARLKEQYGDKDKEVKRSFRKDKRQWVDDMANEAQEAANIGNMKTVYDVTKLLCNERPKTVEAVKNKEGNLLTKEEDLRKRWMEHFREVLNRPDPINPTEILTGESIELDIETGPPTEDEIRRALKEMKLGKAPSEDNITVEILKSDVETTVKELHKLFNIVWTTGKAPKDWRR